MRYFWSVFAFFCLAFSALAQEEELSNVRQKTIWLQNGDSITLDSLSIFPSTFEINIAGQKVDSSWYQLYPYRAALVWKNASSDSVNLKYRVFPFSITAPVSNKDTSIIGVDPQYAINPFQVTADPIIDPFGSSELQKNGSISRGINFGNNQDLTVNSNMNIQLSGKISDDLTVRASINDQNIPFQVEGSTQKLQEFDQVFIEVQKKDNILRAGDYRVVSDDFAFLKFNKKAQGAQLYLQSDSLKYQMTTGVAVSRGKFNRMALPIKEGNQGPYRLEGSENEQFIIVLSGTERVFMDGEVLQRGRDLDYIIDYNTAEITFTANRMVTKDKRVWVEFQYADQNYARSMMYNLQSWQHQKWKFDFGVYSEQDAKNQSLQQQLDNSDKLLLSTVGDDLLSAIKPNIDSIAFNSNEVLYAQKDTVVNSTNYSDIFVYSTNPEEAFYRLGFTYLGAGQGNYVIDNLGTNGRVYKWISPVDGVMQGSYEPVILLISPKQKQMMVGAASYQINDRNKVYFESALSKEDLNTFSDLDGNDDVGMAFNTGIISSKPLKTGKTPGVSLQTQLDYRHIQENFRGIERFRPVEFERDWNINTRQLKSDENLATISTGLVRKGGQKIMVGQTYYQVRDTLSGLKSFSDINWRFGPGFTVQQTGSYLVNQHENNPYQFIRSQATVTKKVGLFRLQAKDLYEQNELQNIGGDGFRQGSFGIHDWQGAILSLDTAKLGYRIYYGERLDKGWRDEQLKNSTYAHNTGAEFQLLKNRAFAFDLGSNYRVLENLDTTITNQQNEALFLNKLNLKSNLLKGFFQIQSFYEFGSGQELKKEYYYIQVPSGTGNYGWNDYNENGIQELNEFEIAIYSDQANFIRVWRPTSDYIRTYSNQLNQSIQINPDRLLKKDKGWKKLLSRFNETFSYRTAQKTSNNDWTKASNPFDVQLESDELISVNSSIRNILSFNRISSQFGVEYTVIENSSKILLSNGYESRQLNTNQVNLRYNFSKVMGFNFEGALLERNRQSEFFDENNYQISGYNIEPEYFYQPSSYFRSTITVLRQFKENQSTLNETLENDQYTLELRWSKVQQINLSTSFSYANINYTANSNTPLAFDMLDGLKPGENFLWTLMITKNLNKSLQMNLQYNGRKTGDLNVIHNGGLQLRAIL